MPITLKDLKAKIATVDVYEQLGRDDLAGELLVTYRLHTPPSSQQTKAAQLMKGDDVGALLDFTMEQAVGRITEWDLMGEDGKPLPITPEVLRDQVPASLLQDIGRAITLHSQPSK